MLINNKDRYINLEDGLFNKKNSNKEEFFKKSIRKRVIFLLNKYKILPKFLKNKLDYFINTIKKDVNYYSKDRIAIYTVIFGSYDILYDPVFLPDNCDFYIITDQSVPTSSKWKKLDINLKNSNIANFSSIEKNRYYKMHPHLLFPEYKYSLYLDGNINVISDPTEFLSKISKHGIAVHNHFRRKCVYDEIESCKKNEKTDSKILLKHQKFLEENGMPRDYGMLELPIILRKHHNSKCIEIMEDWWNEYSLYSKRDQISFPHVLFKKKIRTNELSTLGEDIYSNYAFRKIKHNKL